MDFQADGQPFEAPLEDANKAYENVSTGLGRTIGSMFGEGPLPALGRAAERGQYAGSSWFDQMVNMTPVPVETPTITPEEANKKYSPEGENIFDKPIQEGLAQVIGKQKNDEISRNTVIQRYSNSHNVLENFGVGTMAFVLDPLNDASFLVPGLGEDAVLGVLGKGFLGRTAARAVSGGTAVGLGQMPLTGLKYGLGKEEASDYSIRDAMRDVAFGVGQGAFFGAGIGLGREAGILAPDHPMARALEDRLDSVRKIVNAKAETTHAAISTSVSQLMDGKPVEVQPLFDPSAHIDTAARLISPDTFKEYDRLNELYNNLTDPAQIEYLRGQKVKEAQSTVDNILATVGGDESKLAESNKSRLDNARKLVELSKTLDTPEIAQMRIRAQEVDAKLRDLIPQVEKFRENAEESLNGRNGVLLQENIMFRQFIHDHITNVAEAQKELYKTGYAPGIPQGDMATTKGEMYAPKEEIVQPKPTGEKLPEDDKLQDLEQQWANESATTALLPEEHEELQASQQAIQEANMKEQGLNQAAECVKGAGI